MDKLWKKLKLTIELVPRTSWCENLREVLPSSQWNKIRKRVYAEYDQRCGICRAEGSLNCHELWEYDDQKHIQTLVGFVALCDLCHRVKHIGHTTILARKGYVDYEEVAEHFMTVNDCDRATFERYKEVAIKQWMKRSEHEWDVDMGEYADMACAEQMDFFQQV
jgi:hypothetical protein